MPKQLTPSNPSAALVDLSLNAVALCNVGANSRADIILFKRKEKKSMTFDELMKSLNEAQANIVTEHIASIEKALNADIEKLQGQVTTLEKAKPAAPAEEDVLKGASPEIKAMIEKMQSTISTLVSDKAEELAKTRFEKCKAIPCEEDTLKEVLKTASPTVVAVLEKAAAAIESKVLTTKGKVTTQTFTADNADTHYASLEKSAKELMKTNEELTFEQAFVKACAANPDVYRAYKEGVDK